MYCFSIVLALLLVCCQRLPRILLMLSRWEILDKYFWWSINIMLVSYDESTTCNGWTNTCVQEFTGLLVISKNMNIVQDKKNDCGLWFHCTVDIKNRRSCCIIQRLHPLLPKDGSMEYHCILNLILPIRIIVFLDQLF